MINLAHVENATRKEVLGNEKRIECGACIRRFHTSQTRYMRSFLKSLTTVIGFAEIAMLLQRVYTYK